MYKRVQKNQNYTWLICAAQNMKNIPIKKDNIDSKSSNIIQILQKMAKFIKIIFKKSVQKNL